MTRQRYSVRESINRILRLFEGKPVPTDAPETIPGDVLSVDGAASDLAELLANSLPNEVLSLPDSVVTALMNSGFYPLSLSNDWTVATFEFPEFPGLSQYKEYRITGSQDWIILNMSFHLVTTGTVGNRYFDYGITNGTVGEWLWIVLNDTNAMIKNKRYIWSLAWNSEEDSDFSVLGLYSFINKRLPPLILHQNQQIFVEEYSYTDYVNDRLRVFIEYAYRDV